MTFSQDRADLFIPDNAPREEAIPRTTHLGIGAHADDLEFMALHGILACFQQGQRWFGGVTCTDGSGSARNGAYADWSAEKLVTARAREQRAAATIGQYSFVAQLAHPSASAREAPNRRSLVEDLIAILSETRPSVVYTHNPFDKHGTHLGVLCAVLEAMAELPEDRRPEQVYGCEVWRGLDWLPDDRKVAHNVGGRPHLAAALSGVFDSQIAGGKRYDLAIDGRRAANATFFDSHQADHASHIAFAVDLTPVAHGCQSLGAFVQECLDAFCDEVTHGLVSREVKGPKKGNPKIR